MHQIDRILSDYISSLPNESKKDKSEMFFLHYPLLKEHGKSLTLDEIAEKSSVTRESVRQSIIKICQKIRQDQEVYTELLSVMELIESLIPASLEFIDNELIKQNKILSPVTIHLVKIFQRVNEESTIKFVSRYNTVEDENSEEMSSLICSYFTKKVVHNGVVSEQELMSRFHDIVHSPKTLISIIEANLCGVKEVASGYYYMGDQGRNRLINRLKTLSSVYQSANIDLIRNAIERSWSKDINKEMKGNSFHQFDRDTIFTQVPSCEAIMGVIEDLSIGRREGDSVIFGSDPIDVSSLKWAEVETINLFKSEDTLREKIIEKHLITKNPKKRYACMQMLNNSPILAKQERGLYKLLGDLKKGL